MPFPRTTSGIHLGLAFDYDITDPHAVGRNVDWIWGAYFADWDLAVHPDVRVMDGYLPFDTDAWQQDSTGHSLAWWQQNHPSWVVYRCDRTTPAYYGSGNTNVPLDFSNPAVRAWQVRQAASLFAAGATGVTFDDFNFTNFEGRCGVYHNGVWTSLGYPPQGQDNAKYNSDMMSWLRDVSSQLHREFPDKTIGLNFSGELGGLQKLKAITPYIDDDFDEAGFSDFGAQPLSGVAWRREVEGIDYLNRHGRAVMVNGIVKAASNADVTHAELNWALANYLLVKGSHTYTYVYAGDDSGYTGSPSGYGSFYDRPEYHIPIGFPTSPRYQADGVQMRDYSGGLILVNPSATATFTVRLPGAYTDMWNVAHRSVTLSPTTGIVLLGATPSGYRDRHAGPPSRRRRRRRRHQRQVRAT